MQDAPDRETLTATIRRLGNRVAGLLDEAGDQAASPVPPTPGWDVRDVAAHLAAVVTQYAGGPEGQATFVDDPADLPALNQRMIDELGPAPLPELTARLRGDVEALVEQILAYPDPAPSYVFNGGEQVRADDALGLLAGELLVHGADLAEVLGRPWTISAADVEVVLHGAEPILPGYVHPERAAGHTATYELRIRGGGTHLWRFEDGRLDCRPDRVDRIDCHLSGDPGTLLLVMYGRIPPWRAALTGGVLAWGWRPWLGLSLGDRLHAP